MKTVTRYIGTIRLFETQWRAWMSISCTGRTESKQLYMIARSYLQEIKAG
jgi:hypothetical protein